MLVRVVIRWVISAVLLVFVAKVVPGISVTWISALLAALVLGLINAILKPAIDFLAKPFTMRTFGLILLVINGALFLLTAALVPGFHVDNLLASIGGAFVYGVLGALANIFTWFGEKTAGRFSRTS